MSKLSDKQERFAREYIIDLNATQAAIRAGYSPRTANEQAARLLAKVSVSERIAELKAKAAKRNDLTVDSVLDEIKKVGYANMLDYVQVQPDGTAQVDLSKLTRDQAAAIESVQTEEVWEAGEDGPRRVRKIKFKLAPKLPALDMLMKRLGGYAPVKGDLSVKHEFADVTGIPQQTLEDIVRGES